MSNGMSPDEIRKAYAAKAERLIAENAKRAAFLAKLEDPAVRKAAMDAARALDALDKLGLQVTDYCMIGRRVAEVEVEDNTGSYDKGWIKLRD